jgi:hypothetical protein
MEAVNPARAFTRHGVLLQLLAAVAFGHGASRAAEAAFFRGEFLQQPDHMHNHGSCIVETPAGDLLACWFYGSGER